MEGYQEFASPNKTSLNEQLVPIHIFRQPHPRQKIIAGLQRKAFERKKVKGSAGREG
jgi:hypothetical protein